MEVLGFGRGELRLVDHWMALPLDVWSYGNYRRTDRIQPTDFSPIVGTSALDRLIRNIASTRLFYHLRK